jgi:ABC-type transport system involved in cytochrome bd biosynthesis fused ATPase/permease subunit
MGTGIGATFLVIAFLLGLVLLVTWIVLPFIMMKMSARVQQQIVEQQKTNQLLSELLASQRPQG